MHLLIAGLENEVSRAMQPHIGWFAATRIAIEPPEHARVRVVHGRPISRLEIRGLVTWLQGTGS